MSGREFVVRGHILAEWRVTAETADDADAAVREECLGPSQYLGHVVDQVVSADRADDPGAEDKRAMCPLGCGHPAAEHTGLWSGANGKPASRTACNGMLCGCPGSEDAS